jgi:hypothetical protein
VSAVHDTQPPPPAADTLPALPMPDAFEPGDVDGWRDPPGSGVDAPAIGRDDAEDYLDPWDEDDVDAMLAERFGR